MANTNHPASSMDLTSLNTENLARQAIKLFSKRYGRLYDSQIKKNDPTGKGFVTFDEYYKHFMDKLPEKASLLQKCWYVWTGGHAPSEVPSLNREQLINLCITGFHSKDPKRVERLAEDITEICNFYFDLFDTNGDGEISKEEYIMQIGRTGEDTDPRLDGFHAMDLNGDGHIDREEYQQCCHGFFFHIGEERYNHFFGKVQD